MKIPKRFINQAKPLAARPYSTIVTYEAGFYLAQTLELKHCLGQGKTAEEAIKDCNEARVGFIASMLMYGQDVPAPCGDTPYKVHII